MTQQYLEAVLTARDNGFTSTMTNAQRKLGDFGSSVESSDKKTSGLFKTFTLSHLATNAVTKAINAVSDAVGDAVSRFDTMEKFPVMMENLGFSTEDTEKSIKKLSKGIEGLPTRLDEVVATTQNLALMNGDLQKSTNLTLALNNAFLASGSSAGDASRGLVQFTQMLSSGKVDMQSWKTLQETMPLALNKTAEAFGFAGENAKNEFYLALQSGEITFDQFADKLIELNDGVGGFAELAKINSKGIATSFKNMRTAVVNGVANVIKKLDDLSKAVTGSSIAENFDKMKVVIKTAFNVISGAIDLVMPAFEALGKVIKFIGDNSQWTTPLLYAFAAGLTALMIVKTLNSKMTEFGGAINLVANYAPGLGIVVKVIKEFGVVKGISLLVSGGFSSMAIAVKGFLTAIGPVGWIIGGVTAALGALVAVISRTSPEMEEMADNAKKSAEEVNNLAESVSSSKKAYDTNQAKMRATGDDMRTLGRRAEELANKTNRTAAETKEMNSVIDELNGYLGDNVVQYNKQTNSLNVTSKAMEDYIKVAEKEAELDAMIKRRAELKTQEIELIQKQKQVQEDLTKADEEYNNQWQTWIGNGKKAKEAKEDLTKADEELTNALKENGASQKALSNELAVAYEESAKAQEEAMKHKADTLVELSEEEKKILEEMQSRYDSLVKATGEMFSKIAEESKVSKEEMLENLRANQKAVEEWGDNLTKIGEVVPKRLVQELAQMGPGAAAEIAVMASMSEDELREWVALMDNRSTVATEAWTKSLEAGVDDNMVPAVNKAGDKVMHAADETMSYQKAYKVGKNLPEGASEGINQSTGKAVQAASRTQQKALNMLEQNLYGESYKIGQEMPQGVSQGVDSKAKLVEDSAKTTKKGAQDTFSQVESDFKVYGLEVGSGLVSGMKQQQDAIYVNSKHLLEKARSAFTGVYGIFQSLGRNISSGLSSGISNGGYGVYNAAYNMAISAQRAVRSALSIHSPSRVMMGLANYTVDGFIKPIEQRQKDVREAMMKMVDIDPINRELSMSMDNLKPNIQSDINSKLSADVNISKEPAYFNFEIFGKNFEYFVDDINKVIQSKETLELEYRGI